MRLQPVYFFALICFLFSLMQPAAAIPILAIDLDPSTPGIQDTRTVTAGSSFNLDIVFSGDGNMVTAFDTAILAVYFNDSVIVLDQTGVFTAGALAGRAPSVVDSFRVPLANVMPGDALTSIPIAGALGRFASNSGLVGLQSTGGPVFSFLNSAESIQVMSLEFLALEVGETNLLINNITVGSDDPELALTPDVNAPSQAPIPVPAQLNGATVRVIDPAAIPEPASGLLLAGGLLLLARRRL